jgi:iron complex transport system substrate-binding protein
MLAGARRGRFLLLVLLLSSCASACRGARQTGVEPGPPRVVSLHDVTTELLVALGASAQLVGVSKLVDPTDEVRSAVRGVREVAGLESLLAERPSLVLGLAVTGEQEPLLVSRLRAQGIQVYLADPGNLDALYAMTREVGVLLGASARAEALERTLRQRIAESTVEVPEPRRVFVYDCCDPPFSAGGRGMLNQLIERAGGHNIFADLNDDWASVSWEEVLARRPELVVVHAYAYAGQRDVDGKRAELARIPSLAGLPTVVLPLGCALGGLRSAEGLERLRRALADLT